ncbi:MAG: class I SAM-dependent methyltransferase [Candidatus Thiodiazotropha sp. (ex Ctena orbiculata)]|nr:class I SAM-dependent methyltransferase [Candidatus Thiodiazotropha taylori]
MNTEDRIKERYQGDQGREYHGKKREIPDDAFPWVAQLRYEKIAPQVRSSDVVMEYGVGFGWNMAKLNCHKRLGFDLAQHLEPMLKRQGIEFISDTSTLSDHSVDVMVCHHVLEHVPVPIDVLAEIRRLLKDDGKLLLFVPYEKEKRYRKYDPQEPNHHLYAWNVQTLGNLVNDCGFEIASSGVRRFGYDRFAANWAQRLGFGESGFRLIRWAAHTLKPTQEVSMVATPR